MRYIFLSTACILLLGCTGFKSNPATFAPVAVVELFTSEGCSSCPPADRLVTQLLAQSKATHDPIYLLTYHVDYWNRLGWRDSFSTSGYSDRQQEYADALGLSTVYTPQIIVNGTNQLVGSEEQGLQDAVKAALKVPAKASFVMLTRGISSAGNITIQYQLIGDYQGCEVALALVANTETTAVKWGENAGSKLMHSNIVRQLVLQPANRSGSVTFAPAPLPKDDNITILAIVQRRADRSIIAAAEVK